MNSAQQYGDSLTTLALITKDFGLIGNRFESDEVTEINGTVFEYEYFVDELVLPNLQKIGNRQFFKSRFERLDVDVSKITHFCSDAFFQSFVKNFYDLFTIQRNGRKTFYLPEVLYFDPYYFNYYWEEHSNADMMLDIYLPKCKYLSLDADATYVINMKLDYFRGQYFTDEQFPALEARTIKYTATGGYLQATYSEIVYFDMQKLKIDALTTSGNWVSNKMKFFGLGLSKGTNIGQNFFNKATALEACVFYMPDDYSGSFTTSGNTPATAQNFPIFVPSACLATLQAKNGWKDCDLRAIESNPTLVDWHHYEA